KNRNEIRPIFPTGLALATARALSGGAYIINEFFSTFKPTKTGTESGQFYPSYRFSPRYRSGNIHILRKDRKSVGEQQYNSCRICRF
ncbi:hypothetical protein, partial [Bacteroides uniformis]|uniref:hypothetical protein n=1 Tax=Bacteroides uniformis TaxID=820 RepID=UPI001961B91F